MKKSLLLVILSVLMLCLCSCSKDDSDSSTRENRRRQKDTETVENDTDDDDDYDVDYDDFDDDDYDFDDDDDIDYDDDDIDYDNDDIDYGDYDYDYDDYDDYDVDYDDDDIDYDDPDYDDYDSDDYDFDYQDDDYDDPGYTDYDDTDSDDPGQGDLNPGGNTDDEPKNIMADPIDQATGMRVLTDYDGNPVVEFKLPAGYTFTGDNATSYDLMFSNEENEDLYLEISFSDHMYYGDVLKTGRQIQFGEYVAYTDSETLGTELEGSDEDEEYEYSHTIILLGYDQNNGNRPVYSNIEYGDVPLTYRLLYVQLGENSFMWIRSRSFQQDGIFNVDAINAQIDFYNSMF